MSDEKTKPDELIRQAVVLLRRGKSVRAEKLVQENNLADHFKKFQNILSYNEFSELCKLSSLSNEALAKLIKLDLEIRNIEFEMDTRSDDQAWQKMFQKRLPDRIKQIDFETVCEFDPNKSVYQNNSWRRPN